MKFNSICIAVLIVMGLVSCESSGTEHKAENTGPVDQVEMIEPHDPERHPWLDIYRGQVVFSSMTININSRGKWMAHEGELGYVELFNEKDSLLDKAFMRSKDGKWMTSGDAWFTVEIDFDAGESTEGKLVFHNNHVSEEGGNTEEKFEVPVRFGSAFGDAMYFVRKTASPMEEGKSNYHFVKLLKGPEGEVMGYSINAPYGTDGSRGSFSGKFDADNGAIKGVTYRLAEGDFSKENIAYTLQDDRLEFDFQEQSGSPYSVDRVSGEQFEKLVKEYEDGAFEYSLNTRDRTRVLGLTGYDEYDFSREELAGVRFYETEIDLDTKWETREFLLYLMDPMICGSGGCTMFVIDENTRVLSRTTVVKLPVYMRTSRARGGSMSLSGWRDVLVWSDGAYRQLTNAGEGYSSNASVVPATAMENLEYYPEKYFKVMDHQE